MNLQYSAHSAPRKMQHFKIYFVNYKTYGLNEVTRSEEHVVNISTLYLLPCQRNHVLSFAQFKKIENPKKQQNKSNLTNTDHKSQLNTLKSTSNLCKAFFDGSKFFPPPPPPPPSSSEDFLFICFTRFTFTNNDFSYGILPLILQ